MSGSPAQKRAFPQGSQRLAPPMREQGSASVRPGSASQRSPTRQGPGPSNPAWPTTPARAAAAETGYARRRGPRLGGRAEAALPPLLRARGPNGGAGRGGAGQAGEAPEAGRPGKGGGERAAPARGMKDAGRPRGERRPPSARRGRRRHSPAPQTSAATGSQRKMEAAGPRRRGPRRGCAQGVGVAASARGSTARAAAVTTLRLACVPPSPSELQSLPP